MTHHFCSIIRFSAALILLTSVTSGCANLYTLPDAPAKSEWVAYDDLLPENEEEKVQRFIESKRAAIKLYAALASHDFEEAIDFMATDTVAFLSEAADGRGPVAALESGKIYKDGKEFDFNPADVFYIENLSDIRDDFGKEEQKENKKRKELFAVNSNGQARRIVMILEQDRWKFYATSIDSPILKE